MKLIIIHSIFFCIFATLKAEGKSNRKNSTLFILNSTFKLWNTL